MTTTSKRHVLRSGTKPLMAYRLGAVLGILLLPIGRAFAFLADLLARSVIARVSPSHAGAYLLSVLVALAAPSAFAITLDQVRSYIYAIAVDVKTPNLNSILGNANVDLIILSGANTTTPLNKKAFDPSNSKLIFSYIDVPEASPYWEPDLFVGGQKSSIVGNPNTGFPNLY